MKRCLLLPGLLLLAAASIKAIDLKIVNFKEQK